MEDVDNSSDAGQEDECQMNEEADLREDINLIKQSEVVIYDKQKVSISIMIHSMIKDDNGAVVSHVTVSIVFRTVMSW